MENKEKLKNREKKLTQEELEKLRKEIEKIKKENLKRGEEGRKYYKHFKKLEVGKLTRKELFFFKLWIEGKLTEKNIEKIKTRDSESFFDFGAYILNEYQKAKILREMLNSGKLEKDSDIYNKICGEFFDKYYKKYINLK